MPNKAPFGKLYVCEVTVTTHMIQLASSQTLSSLWHVCLFHLCSHSAVLVRCIALCERDSLHLGWPGSNREAHTLGTNGNGRRLTFDYTQVLDCGASYLVSVPHIDAGLDYCRWDQGLTALDPCVLLVPCSLFPFPLLYCEVLVLIPTSHRHRLGLRLIIWLSFLLGCKNIFTFPVLYAAALVPIPT